MQIVDHPGQIAKHGILKLTQQSPGEWISAIE
jgi:hypothetical protein